MIRLICLQNNLIHDVIGYSPTCIGRAHFVASFKYEISRPPLRRKTCQIYFSYLSFKYHSHSRPVSRAQTMHQFVSQIMELVARNSVASYANSALCPIRVVASDARKILSVSICRAPPQAPNGSPLCQSATPKLNY